MLAAAAPDLPKYINRGCVSWYASIVELLTTTEMPSQQFSRMVDTLTLFLGSGVFLEADFVGLAERRIALAINAGRYGTPHTECV